MGFYSYLCMRIVKLNKPVKIKRISFALLLLALSLFISSCGSVKDVAYLQGVDKENPQMAIQTEGLFDGTIKPKDLLIISVQTVNPELAAPFNGVYWNPNQQYAPVSERQRTYLVDNDGRVDLPILGQVKLGGLSITNAEQKLKVSLEKYFSETPSVNIKQTNYRYAVIGEVKRPGAFVSENGKVNIYEALANAGDMTIYGQRDEVKLIREQEDGSKTVVLLDIKDANIIKSPYFYLQQGDVLYVQPNAAIAKASNVSSGVTIWFSVASIGLSVTTLLATLLRK